MENKLYKSFRTLIFALCIVVFLVQIFLRLQWITQPVAFDETRNETKYQDSVIFQELVNIELQVSSDCAYRILLNGQESDRIQYDATKTKVSIQAVQGDVIQFQALDDAFVSASVFVVSVGKENTSVVPYTKIIVEKNMQTLFTLLF